MPEAPGLFDSGVVPFLIAIVAIGFNVWLLLRVLGFMRTVEIRLEDIERNTSKTADGVKKLGE